MKNKTEITKEKQFSVRSCMPMKILAFILVVVTAVMTSASVFMAILMIDNGVYVQSQEECLKVEYKWMACDDIGEIVGYLDAGNKFGAKDFCEDSKSIKSLTIFNKNNKVKFTYNSESDEPAYKFRFKDYEFCYTWADDTIDLKDAVIEIYKTSEHNKYAYAEKIVDIFYFYKYKVYWIGIGSLILFIVCFIYLLRCSGYKKGKEKLQQGWGTKVPLDLLTAVAGVAIIFTIELTACLINELPGRFVEIYFTVIVPIAIGIGVAVLTGWMMSFILRLKLGKWWQNTIIYRVLKIAYKFAKKVAKKIGSFISYIFLSVKFIWKVALCWVAFLLLDFIVVICAGWELDNQLIWFGLSNFVLSMVVIYCAVVISQLQKANHKLAQGDFDYRVDTSRMIGDFKKQGENINNIADGLNLAVEKQMKSERTKTELITNVSHDIKTPLTSIINYTDLICKESCENEKIKEYSEVLLRQSGRLKRLIDDLVEASKATTGNLEVNLAPCNLDVFIQQVAGEYVEKLKERNLELVVKTPIEPVMISADGRRLWRVFDNLMNNVYKYAQSGTRVYLDVEESYGGVNITLKNISQQSLNISEEELMERFVQGDYSRNSDGNGLGLSIAKSLTELQKGKFNIVIDGDLFKAMISFSAIK